MTTPFIIEPQAFTRDRTESSGLWVITVLDPLVRKTAVVFSIIKRLKREPVSLVFLKILIIDALKVKKFKFTSSSKRSSIDSDANSFLCLSITTYLGGLPGMGM